jgi:predicted transcriptional regulator YdeE
MEIINPKIVEKGLVLVGIDRFVKWSDNFDEVIVSSKKELSERIIEIKNIVNQDIRIKYFYSETGMQDGFNYMECVEIVDDNTFVPEGFTIKKLVNTQYAVFVGKQGPEIGKYARKSWLPQSGFKENFAIMGDLEFKNENEEDAEFWLPIVKND